MDDERLEKSLRIERRGQVIRTAINIVVAFMIGIVLYNQTRILNVNHDNLIQVSNNDKRSDAYLKCIAEAFTQTSNNSDAAVAIKQCLSESNLLP